MSTVSSKFAIDLLNQVFELEKKVNELKEPNSLQRNINRLKEIIEHDYGSIFMPKFSGGYIYENPKGEEWTITRTDCDASVAGEGTEELIIIEVIKPIVRLKEGPVSYIVQKGIVVVQSKNSEPSKESNDE